MSILTIDFETRSHCDLKAHGLHNYAADPTTEPLCLGYAFGEEEPSIWTLGESLPRELVRYVANGGTVVAHNAAFELAIWNGVCFPKYGWPVLRIEQVVDTMVEAYAMGLPGALGPASAALGLASQKDAAGHRLMLVMCRPRDDGTWTETPEKLAALYEYCKQDVRAERALYERLLRLSPDEVALWRLDQTINARGFAVDTAAIAAAERIVVAETVGLNKRLFEVTGGAVSAVSNPGQLKDWLAARGFPVDSVDKETVAGALAMRDDLPADVVTALTIRQEGGKASTAKLKALRARVSPDGRVRGTKQFHGAATGRWAGRDVQPDNFPRPVEGTDYEDVIRLILSGSGEKINLLYGPPLKLVSESLRSMIIAPPGRILYGGDFSNIEGRGLAWCAGEEWKLDAFRAYDAGTGPDLYKVAYSRSFGTPVDRVTKAERQVGKVQELALGYQGGYGALATMAAAYGVVVPPKPADSQHPWVSAWRDAHPKVVRWWYALEDAARAAIREPGKTFSAGPSGREVRFKVSGSFLWCRLQSGRVLCYPYARIGTAKTPWGSKPDAILYKYVNQTTRKWEEGPTYGGSLAENVVQAICRDILAAALVRLERAGYAIVLHVHDEAISERDSGTGSVEEFERLMVQSPEWAAGWPISVGAWTGKRWDK
jgi:DNA polymerase bacteriophage-type